MTAFLSVAPPRPAAAGVCQWMKELKTLTVISSTEAMR
jgi:hypothetical protein